MGDAWEWELDGDAKISARIEMPDHVESVYLGPRLVSRSGVGGKLADHVVQLPPPKVVPQTAEVYRASSAPNEAVLTFDPAPGFGCKLRVGGQVVAPTVEPDPVSRAIASSPQVFRTSPRGWIKGAAVVVAVGVVAIIAAPSISGGLAARALRNKIIEAHAETELTETTTSADRSLQASFPSDFEPTVDEQGAIIGLHREQKLEMLALISMPRPDLDDPRDLDKIMMRDLVAFADRSKAKMSTTITRKDTCHGDPDGVVSTATMTQADGIEIKVVACTLLKDGRGYFFAYFVPEIIAEREEPTLRAIVDATKLSDPPSVTTTTISINGTITPHAPRAPRDTDTNTDSDYHKLREQSPPGYPRGTTITTTPRPGDTRAFANDDTRPRPSPLPPSPPRSQRRADPSAPNESTNRGADALRDRRMREYRRKIPW